MKFIKSKKFAIIVTSCLLVFFVFLFVFSYLLNTPLSKNVEEKIFVIEEGEGLEEIAKNLRKEGLIVNDWTFIFYVLLRGKAKKVQAGEYSLSPSMDIAEIARKIIHGEIVQDWIKVTIFEGWTNKQIEEKFIELGILNPEEYEFFKIATEDFPFLADRPSGPNLQGYLFPDTYYFEKKSSPEVVSKKMLTNFGEKLTEDLREGIKQQNKTIYEIITMASIVQNEVSSVEDMRKVAGIFYNRLKSGIPLQSDATINYITGKNLRQPLFEDTKVESPYNTYLHSGLPPGPISNPGIEAIKAAIYPEDTDYMYFLNPLDGTTIFSKTLEEHNQNKKKYLE